MRRFAAEAAALGCNAVTLDDVVHLVPQPQHGEELNRRIEFLRGEFVELFGILREAGLQIFLTSDVMPVSSGVLEATNGDHEALNAWFRGLVGRLLDDFPDLSGVVLRIGESDGKDVRDELRSRLHLRRPDETRQFLKQLLPEFERRGKTLVFRTWTVGAHRIGDLMWHRRTLGKTLEGIDSPSFVVSMKYGESDFFRYLPLNRAFFRVSQPKIIEFQARREYEGAGEYPSFIGWDCERFARELEGVDGLIGVSIWCQTGGWHGFRRLALLEEDGSDIWIRLNLVAVVGIFRDRTTVESVVEQVVGSGRAPAVLELLRHAETVVRELLYVEEFARQKLFFRRIRIPPLLHAYWDCLFVSHGIRKVLRHFVTDPERALRGGETAYRLFERMIELAKAAELPVEDVEFMRDTMQLVVLARRYYFLPWDPQLAERVRSTKKAYKKRWPRDQRQRYRIKTSFERVRLSKRTLSVATSLLLRRGRGYRIIDQLFTLDFLALLYRAIHPAARRKMPKFLKKSAMGIDAVLK
jgi:hypothetical protein